MRPMVCDYLLAWFLLLTRKMGMGLIRMAGYIMGHVLYYLPNPVRWVSKKNIQYCFPQQSTKQNRRLLRLSLVELCRGLLELGPLWGWPVERLQSLVLKEQGVAEIDHCLEQGQGVLIITPHYGSWELLGLMCPLRFPCMTFMYNPPKIQALGGYMKQARTRAGARLVGIERSGIKAILQALYQGEVVGMLPDQEPKQGAFVYAPFFGNPARTMTLFNKLARKTKAAVFMVNAQRKTPGYVIQYRRLSIDQADEQQAATLLNQAIETVILQHPEQYLWAYKRFKFSPSGGRSYLYKK